MEKEHVLIVLSGGIDSVVLAHAALDEGKKVSALAIDYNQRHRKELDYAERAAAQLGIDFVVADLSGYSALMRGYSLTDSDIDVPAEHYSETGSVNVIPNRNPVFMTMACAHAVTIGAQEVAVGFIAEDATTCPDTSPEFLAAFNVMEAHAIEGLADPPPKVTAPFITLRKAEVIHLGEKLGVDWTTTWTCFCGLDIHCGVCASCYDRREAFVEAGIADPTTYEKD